MLSAGLVNCMDINRKHLGLMIPITGFFEFFQVASSVLLSKRGIHCYPIGSNRV